MDDNMHGGRDRIESTILKSKTNSESDHLNEEHIEQDIDMVNTPEKDDVSDNMEVDIIIDDDKDSSIIKINHKGIIENNSEVSGPLKDPTKIDDEIVQMDPRYARVLDEIVYTEFMQLKRECDEIDNKRKNSKKLKPSGEDDNESQAKTKSYYPKNFMYILQKRLKKRISSRKTKYYALNSEIKESQIDPDEE